MSSREQPAQPLSEPRVASAQGRQGRASALDQHLAQVLAAAFGNAEQTRLASCRRLPRDKPEPRGEVATPRESLCITDGRDKRSCVKRANPGNARQPAGGLVPFCLCCELSQQFPPCAPPSRSLAIRTGPPLRRAEGRPPLSFSSGVSLARKAARMATSAEFEEVCSASGIPLQVRERRISHQRSRASAPMAFPSDFGLRPALRFGIRGGWRERRDDVGDFGMHIASRVFGRNRRCAAFAVIRESAGDRAQSAVKKTVCGCCGRSQKGWYDHKICRVRDLSCGDTRIFLELEVRRLDCRNCGRVKRERLDFLADNPHYTKRFAYYVGRRCRSATIKDVAANLRLD